MMRFSQDDDDLAASRGILLAVVIGLFMWTGIILLCMRYA